MIVRGLIPAALALGTAAVAQPVDRAAPPPAPMAAPATPQIAGPVLMVRDLDRSLKFYTEALGLVIGTRLPGAAGPGATVIASAAAPAPFLLLRQQAATPAQGKAIRHGDGLSRIMLLVADSAAIAARLDGMGYPHTPLTDHHVFFVNDPDGYRYEIMQRDSRH